MSLWDQVLAAQDEDLLARITVCAAGEGIPNPLGWATANRYRLAASPGWDDQWASAIAGRVENPGRDATVITDSDILAAIQTIRNEAD